MITGESLVTPWSLPTSSRNMLSEPGIPARMTLAGTYRSGFLPDRSRSLRNLAFSSNKVLLFAIMATRESSRA